MQKLNEELSTLENMECERLAELFFSEIKEKLYLNSIPLKSIPQKAIGKNKHPTLIISPNDPEAYSFYLGPFKTKRQPHFEAHLYWGKKPIKDRQGRDVLFLVCDIKTKGKKTYTNHLFVYAYPEAL